MKLSSSNLTALIGLGAALLLTATDALGQSDSLDDKKQYAIAHINRSWNHAHDKRYKEAIDEQNIALKIREGLLQPSEKGNVDTLKCYQNIGWLYLQSKDFSKAIESYNIALAIDVPDANSISVQKAIRRDLAWTLHSCGRFREALDVYESLLVTNFLPRDKRAVVLKDAVKVIDDMCVDNVMTIDARDRCESILSEARQWAQDNNQPVLVYRIIGRQVQLLSYFDGYAKAEERLYAELKTIYLNNPNSIDNYANLWLQEIQLALLCIREGQTMGLPIQYPTRQLTSVLEKFLKRADRSPGISNTLPYQAVHLQICILQDTDPLAALQGYYDMLQSGSPATGDWLIAGQACLTLRDYDRGLSICSTVLKRPLSPIEEIRIRLLSTDIYLAKSQWDKAKDELKSAEAACHGDPVPLNYAVMLDERRARVYFERGEFEKAYDALSTTVERCSTDDDDRLAKARALVNRGECELELYKFAEAEGSFFEAGQLFLKALGQAHSEISLAARGTGRARQGQGKYDAAKKCFEYNINLDRKCNRRASPEDLELLASLYIDTGDYRQARVCLADLRKDVVEDSEADGRACLTSGVLEYAIGDYRGSEQELLRGLTIVSKLKARPSGLISRFQFALGNVYSKQMRWQESAKQYAEVLKATGAPSDLKTASRAVRRQRADTLLGLCASARQSAADLPQAVAYAKEATLLYEQSLCPNHPSIATAYEELGACHQANGEYSAAAKDFQDCMDIRIKRYPKWHPSVMRILNNLAAAAITEAVRGKPEDRQAKYDLAQRYLKEGVDAFESGHAGMYADTPVICRAHANWGLLYAVQRRTKEALAEYDKSLRGYLFHMRRNLIGLDEREQLAFIQGELQPTLHAAYSFALENTENQDVCRAAAEWAANFKGLSHEIVVATYLMNKDSGESANECAATANQIGRLHLQIAGDDAPGDTKYMQQLVDQQKSLLLKLGGENHRNEKWRRCVDGSAQWLVISDVRKQLSSADALLVDYATFWYFDKNDKTWASRAMAIVIPPESESNSKIRLVDLGPTKSVVASLQAVRSEFVKMGSGGAALNKWDNSSPDEQTAIIAQLKGELAKTFHLVLGFCDSELATKKKLIISPDDDLWFVPWACLPHNDKYLVESHSISLIASSRSLFHHGDGLRSEPTAVIFADPDFSFAEASRPLSSTPAQPKTSASLVAGATAQATTVTFPIDTPNPNETASRPTPNSDRPVKFATFERAGITREVEKIAPQLKDLSLSVSVKVDREACEPSFNAVKQPRFLLLATHGFYDDENPAGDIEATNPPWSAGPAHAATNPLQRCGLALAGINTRNVDSLPNEDGCLTGLEITSCDLRGTELVFLTACETGLGEKRCGEAVAGLYESFQLAGAHSVVGTLWQVDGKAATELTQEFWTNLAKDHDHATALQHAQLAFLKRDQYRHPYFWAAFGLALRN